jgi:tetratricopeptide (TPR) repeat protein
MLNWEKGHLEKAYIGFNQILAMIDEYPELEELVGWGRAKVALHVCALAKSMGRYEEALGILKELDNLKHSRRVCFTPQLDFEMNQNYADVCSYLGDTDLGLKYGEKALKIVRRIVDENPEDFCSLIDCMVNLASDYLDDGQPGKAVELGTEAYKLTKKKYGPNNEDTVEMKANMEQLQKYSKEPDVVAESIAAKEFGKRRPVAILADVPAEWSGRMVYVHHFDHNSLMYRVELRSIPSESRWMNFAPSNVIFQPGTEILIHSLTQAQELNLKEGAVESFSTKRGRFKVNLQEPSKTISVKPENIIPQRFFDYQYDLEKARILARLLTSKNDN